LQQQCQDARDALHHTTQDVEKSMDAPKKALEEAIATAKAATDAVYSAPTDEKRLAVIKACQDCACDALDAVAALEALAKIANHKDSAGVSSDQEIKLAAQVDTAMAKLAISRETLPPQPDAKHMKTPAVLAAEQKVKDAKSIPERDAANDALDAALLAMDKEHETAVDRAQKAVIDARGMEDKLVAKEALNLARVKSYLAQAEASEKEFTEMQDREQLMPAKESADKKAIEADNTLKVFESKLAAAKKAQKDNFRSLEIAEVQINEASDSLEEISEDLLYIDEDHTKKQLDAAKADLKTAKAAEAVEQAKLDVLAEACDKLDAVEKCDAEQGIVEMKYDDLRVAREAKSQADRDAIEKLKNTVARQALDTATKDHARAMQKHSRAEGELKRLREKQDIAETKLQAAKVGHRGTVELQEKDAEDALDRAKTRKDAVNAASGHHHTWKEEESAVEDYATRVTKAQETLAAATEEGKAQAERNLNKWTAALLESRSALEAKIKAIRDDAAEHVTFRTTALAVVREKVKRVDPEAHRGFVEDYHAKYGMMMSAKGAIDTALVKGEEDITAVVDKMADLTMDSEEGEKQIAGIKAKTEADTAPESALAQAVKEATSKYNAAATLAYPGMEVEAMQLAGTNAARVKALEKEKKSKQLMDDLDVDMKKKEKELDVAEEKCKVEANALVTTADAKVAEADAQLRDATAKYNAAQDSRSSRTTEDKKKWHDDYASAKKLESDQDVLLLKAINASAAAENRCDKYSLAYLVTQGKAFHPEHGTLDTCLEAVQNAEIVENLKARLELGAGDADELAEIEALKKKIQAAELKLFLSCYGKLSLPSELLHASYLKQASYALEIAKAKEEAIHPDPNAMNRDGTINLQIVANWGKRDKDGKYEKHFTRSLTHVKRSYTLRHVMMLISEYPDDVGLGVDLTEDALNWIEYEGRQLPEGRTLEDQEIPMHAGLEMCHHFDKKKEKTAEELEAERLRRLRENAPATAAKYTGHQFKDKGTAAVSVMPMPMMTGGREGGVSSVSVSIGLGWSLAVCVPCCLGMVVRDTGLCMWAVWGSHARETRCAEGVYDLPWLCRLSAINYYHIWTVFLK